MLQATVPEVVQEGDGILWWAVIPAFTRYVDTMPDGCVVVEDGALRAGDLFGFPVQSIASRAIVCRGLVRFAGHRGLLQVSIDRPGISLCADRRVELTILDDEQPGARLVFAAGPTRSTLGEEWAGLALTEEASDMFFGRYPPGSPAADARLAPSIGSTRGRAPHGPGLLA